MSSPSEFLTFFRAAFRPVLRNTTRQSVRTFTAAPARCANEGVKTDKYPDSEHATNKKDKLDVQSENSAKGREGRAQDVGGQATRQRDEAGAQKKAKEEFPESPTQIGMQDERGGKGH